MHMQGQIGFDDAPGGGTIFYVDLPAADRMARWQAEITAEADRLRLPRTMQARRQ